MLLLQLDENSSQMLRTPPWNLPSAVKRPFFVQRLEPKRIYANLACEHVNMWVCSTCAYVYVYIYIILYLYVYYMYIYIIIYIYILIDWLHIYLNTKNQTYRYVIGRLLWPICWNKQRNKLNKQLLDFAITRHIMNENISWNLAA